MKTIKFKNAKGFKSGYEYELVETGTGFNVKVGNQIKVFNEKFLQENEHKINEYGAIAA